MLALMSAKAINPAPSTTQEREQEEVKCMSFTSYYINSLHNLFLEVSDALLFTLVWCYNVQSADKRMKPDFSDSSLCL